MADYEVRIETSGYWLPPKWASLYKDGRWTHQLVPCFTKAGGVWWGRRMARHLEKHHTKELLRKKV